MRYSMFLKNQILPTNLLLKNKFLHRLLFVVFAMCFSHATLEAQTTKYNKPEDFTLTGTIVDSETQKPIPHAEIFISGTTRGCISDMQGNFSLKVPYIPCTLVADHVAYETFTTPISSRIDTLKISLKPAIILIEGVKVSGKNNRKKNLRFFYSYFVSNDKRNIEITNDSVLYFKRTNDDFIAYTHEPLIIINKKLGYKIKLRLKQFRLQKAEYPNGPKVPINSNEGFFYVQLSGHYLYEPIEPESLEELLKYKRNRSSFYFGSARHFLSSVYSGTCSQNGFTLETFPKTNDIVGIKHVKSYDFHPNGKEFVIDCDSIQITYEYGRHRYPSSYSKRKNSANLMKEISIIYHSNTIFTIFNNGVSPDRDCIVVGPLAGFDRLAYHLPMDYNPSD